ncbi:hypothetical protein LTR66_010216 [Elasticomyces elasticus]|nr:hypothetical protein LTR66_010216 [Elasticomyces elasticus]
MRLLPLPGHGLHPAIPESPPPLEANDAVSGPTLGGFVGLCTVVGAAALRRPQPWAIATRYAAYAGILCTVGGLLQEEFSHQVFAKPFLKSQNISLPRRKLWERTQYIDQDNFVITGAVAGVLASTLLRRPWTTYGWRRYVGAACFGSLAGDVAYTSLYLDRVKEAKRLRRRRIDEMRRMMPEVMRASAKEWPQLTGRISGWSRSAEELRTPAITVHESLANQKKPLEQRIAHQSTVPPSLSSSGSSPLGSLLGPDGDIDDEEAAANLDEMDPRPHVSKIEEGERIFHPETNYRWAAYGEEAKRILEDHIAHLNERRAGLAKEAEYAWHQIAVREAEFYDTPNGTPEKQTKRIELGYLANVHVNTWLEIGSIDWMIADSNKNLLQLQSMLTKEPGKSGSGHWIPQISDAVRRQPPKHSLKILRASQDGTNISAAELEFQKREMEFALSEPGLELIGEDGKPVKDPYTALKQDLKKLSEAQEMIRESQSVVQKLIDEAETRVRELED